jgi:hypothetical protein
LNRNNFPRAGGQKSHSGLDEAAATVLATLTEVHGIKARVERLEALGATNLAQLDLSAAALVCLSSIELKTPAHIQYAARRLRSRAPDAKVLLGVWSAADTAPLSDLQKAVNADYVARTFHEAAAIILKEATATTNSGEVSSVHTASVRSEV